MLIFITREKRDWKIKYEEVSLTISGFVKGLISEGYSKKAQDYTTGTRRFANISCTGSMSLDNCNIATLNLAAFALTINIGNWYDNSV